MPENFVGNTATPLFASQKSIPTNEYASAFRTEDHEVPPSVVFQTPPFTAPM